MTGEVRAPRRPGTLIAWGRMVRLSHTVFALPFALAGTALATTESPLRGATVVWVLVAMFAARNAAMSFNRLVDHRFDADNPRTATRELPSGKLSRTAVGVATVALAALFVFAAFRLNRLCGALSPLALAIVFGYSFTKRFTWASHWVLGTGLAIAPVGGWLAVTGSFAATPWWLAAAVAAWVTGFDLLYACQDIEFDRRVGLHSFPARFGVRAALGWARVAHATAWALWVGVGLSAGLGPAYWVGLGLVATIFVRQHRLVRPGDLSNLGRAFFDMNAVVSVLYLAAIVMSLWLDRGS